jgi:sugar/nucleoside kinase (ribokinase family)
VVLDADTPTPGIDALLDAVDFPVVSREFAIGRFGSPEAAVRALAEHGARLPVVTLGVGGALALWRGQALASPAFAVDTRDTTGAGDVFHAAFTAALLDGRDARGLLRFANAAAALACRGFGAQGGLPSRSEIESFLAEAKPRIRPA